MTSGPTHRKHSFHIIRTIAKISKKQGTTIVYFSYTVERQFKSKYTNALSFTSKIFSFKKTNLWQKSTLVTFQTNHTR